MRVKAWLGAAHRHTPLTAPRRAGARGARHGTRRHGAGGARGSGTPRSHELYTKYFFEAKCTLVLSEMATPTHETAAVGHGPQLSSRTELNTQDTESDVWAVGSGQAVRPARTARYVFGGTTSRNLVCRPVAMRRAESSAE